MFIPLIYFQLATASFSTSWFPLENCVGAIDGTFIRVTVPAADRARYLTRKGEIAQNVLAACSFDKKFIYVLAG